jgi:hypothetical protein
VSVVGAVVCTAAALCPVGFVCVAEVVCAAGVLLLHAASSKQAVTHAAVDARVFRCGSVMTISLVEDGIRSAGRLQFS